MMIIMLRALFYNPKGEYVLLDNVLCLGFANRSVLKDANFIQKDPLSHRVPIF